MYTRHTLIYPMSCIMHAYQFRSLRDKLHASGRYHIEPAINKTFKICFEKFQLKPKVIFWQINMNSNYSCFCIDTTRLLFLVAILFTINSQSQHQDSKNLILIVQFSFRGYLQMTTQFFKCYFYTCVCSICQSIILHKYVHRNSTKKMRLKCIELMTGYP